MKNSKRKTSFMKYGVLLAGTVLTIMGCKGNESDSLITGTPTGNLTTFVSANRIEDSQIQNKGLEGATVVLNCPGTNPKESLTDSDGYSLMENVPNNSGCTTTSTKDGFDTKTISDVEVIANSTNSYDSKMFPLENSDNNILERKLLDSNGDALSNFSFQFYNSSTGESIDASTNADGFFREYFNPSEGLAYDILRATGKEDVSVSSPTESDISGIYNSENTFTDSVVESTTLDLIVTSYQKDGNWIADKALSGVLGQLYENSDCTGTIYDTATSDAAGAIGLDAVIGNGCVRLSKTDYDTTDIPMIIVAGANNIGTINLPIDISGNKMLRYGQVCDSTCVAAQVGLVIELKDGGTVIDTETTNSNGEYSFVGHVGGYLVNAPAGGTINNVGTPSETYQGVFLFDYRYTP